MARGGLDRVLVLEVRAYSNGVGRGFLGYGLLKISSSSLASGSLRGRRGDATPILTAAPNPFNPETTIRFRSEAPGEAAVRLYDARGALVRTLARQWFPAGTHETKWDGRGGDGEVAASGIYFVRVETSSGASERLKLILLK